MKRVIDILAVLFLVFVLGSCSSVKTHAQNYTPKIKANSNVTITKNWNLNGKTVVLPEGVTLNLKNGEIQNGTLVGNKTKLIGKSKAVFNKVNIEGSWNVPTISSSLFVDLSEDNALRNVMALTDTSVRNVVTIEKGNYSIKLVKNQETGIYIRSNTTLVLNGTIRLKPNAFTNYHVVEATGNNIVIKGSGTIIGDKDTHTGKTGEWGMGLDVARGTNVNISGLTIKDCWGDCIYIGDNSKKVTVDNCTLLNGRRQGISVTSADGVKISHCNIHEIYGTAPGCAIDIEPNENCSVKNVIIEYIKTQYCRSGIVASVMAREAFVDSFTVSNCYVSNVMGMMGIAAIGVDKVSIERCYSENDQNYCIQIQDCKNAVVYESEVNSTDGKMAIFCMTNKNVIFKDNIIKAKNAAFRDMSDARICGNTIECSRLFYGFNSCMNSIEIINNKITGQVNGTFAKSSISNNKIHYAGIPISINSDDKQMVRNNIINDKIEIETPVAFSVGAKILQTIIGIVK